VFVGTFEHSLDDKGRVVLPPTFRARFADGGFVTPYEGCLALWTPEAFEGFVDRLSEKVRAGEAPNNALRAFLAAASEARPDNQGRITIKPSLREVAGLDGEVTLTGARDHVEIWDRGRWADVNDVGVNDLSEAVSKLGLF
jgi:MraZ protein